MDDNQRVELSKLLNEYNTEETTGKIRELKHSKRIREDVGVIQKVRRDYQKLLTSNINMYKQICQTRASFLYNNYTNIFHKVVNDELDLRILSQFLFILEKIENGTIDQHEGSYEAGMLLKKMFVDSALKKEENKERKNKRKNKKVKETPTKKISWSQFKQMNE
jgi:hypothetical protein